MSLLSLARPTVNHPEVVSGEVNLHLASRVIDIMVFVVMIGLVFLEDVLELGIAVRIVRLAAVLLIIDDFISHVAPLHALGIFGKVFLKERIPLLIAIPVGTLPAKYSTQG